MGLDLQKIKNVEDYEDYLLQIHNESVLKRNNNITEVVNLFISRPKKISN